MFFLQLFFFGFYLERWTFAFFLDARHLRDYLVSVIWQPCALLGREVHDFASYLFK
ncbi:hypothetical protein OMAG_001844 [Candidatus Omnitrophus magneticus]|uniref:Uncharacterized protein n=1 Tax=Candidatus Omnitrophus magneticus TaxID=1609969 RepID=A0A0F0CS88_9BACT|nr:hypothetical protein OMAG_001844 [Candidatus Omnitrophus magneticus]